METEKERLTKLANSHPKLARVTLNDWIQRARQLGLKQLDVFCDTLMTWQAGPKGRNLDKGDHELIEGGTGLLM